MKRKRPFVEQVDISLDDSSSSESVDDALAGKQSNNNLTIDQPAKERISEGEVIRRAQMYQKYMKEMSVPTLRGSVIPCTSWTGLANSIKQLYGQPLHYLTNILIKQWDQARFDAEDDLDTIIHPSKAEACIWLVEEIHRLTTSHQYLAKLWLASPMHHAFIDPIFPQL